MPQNLKEAVECWSSWKVESHQQNLDYNNNQHFLNSMDRKKW